MRKALSIYVEFIGIAFLYDLCFVAFVEIELSVEVWKRPRPIEDSCIVEQQLLVAGQE